jgi:hypothetical protein
VSFLLSVLFSGQRRGLFAVLCLSTAIGSGFASLTEISQAFAFHRTIDVPLMGYGVLTGLIGAFTGITFVQGRAARMDGTPGSSHADSSAHTVR